MAAADLAEPAHRGTLTLADKAVEKLARAAVLTASGVAPAALTAGVVSGALGRTLPRVDVARAGSQVDVEVEVASLWPQSAARVADGVREAVTTQLAHLAELTAATVSVAVVRVVRPAHDAERRRVL